MATTFSCADLAELTQVVTTALSSASGLDWSAPAGTLEWSCARTADHIVDTLLAPALFLASRKQDDYPAFGPATMGPTAAPDALIEGIETATRILTAVVTTAEPDAHAIIWRRPRVETRGPADFVPRGALELILHAHDICTGLGIPFAPSRDLCQRLRDHTLSWPHWTSPGWAPLPTTDDPWTDLIHSSGRQLPSSG
jgi:uncharacterized protein (TIGR03083 family)